MNNGVRVEPEKTTMPKDRHFCAALVGPFAHQCANKVAKKGDVCKWHRKVAKRTRPRKVRPDLKSSGAIVRSSSPSRMLVASADHLATAEYVA